MHLHDVRVLCGPNVWANVPVLQADWHVDSVPPESLAALQERLRVALDELQRCSALQALARWMLEQAHATHPVDGLALLVIGIQRQIGSDVDFWRVEKDRNSRGVRLVVEYEEAELGRACLKAAHEWVLAVRDGRACDLEAKLKALRELAYDIRLGPSTGAIARAAQRRGIPTRRLNTGSLVLLGQGSRQRRIVAAEVDQTSILAEALAQDKQLTRALLHAAGVPVPQGRPVSDPDDACQAAEELDGPAVVKPQYGNHGRGVTTNLTTPEQVRQAYINARREGADVVVERYAPGSDYRLLVIGNRLAAAALREPAHVIGDGQSTIEQLVEAVNRDPRRSDGHATVLSIIKLDAVSLTVLADQGLIPASIPAAGQRVLIRRNGNLSTGGTATDVTDQVHPEVAARAVEAAQVLGLDIAGVDVIVTDIGQPLEKQGGVIVEVNAGPGLRMHLEPSGGQARPVGEDIVNLLFPHTQTGRIPVAAVAGTAGAATAASLLAYLLRDGRQTVGRTSGDGTFIDQRRLHAHESRHAQGALDLLLNPGVDLAVLETSLNGVLEAGLGFDHCDVAVVPSMQSAGAGASVTHQAAVTLLRTVRPEGAVVLHADDPASMMLGRLCPADMVCFAQHEQSKALAAQRAMGRRVVFFRKDRIVLAEPTHEYSIAVDRDLPSQDTLGDCSILAAVSAAWIMGRTPHQIEHRLRAYAQERGPRTTPRYATSVLTNRPAEYAEEADLVPAEAVPS